MYDEAEGSTGVQHQPDRHLHTKLRVSLVFLRGYIDCEDCEGFIMYIISNYTSHTAV